MNVKMQKIDFLLEKIAVLHQYLSLMIPRRCRRRQ
jgi:hypothetical protein